MLSTRRLQRNGKIQKKKVKNGGFSEKGEKKHKRPNKRGRVCRPSFGTAQIARGTAEPAGQGSKVKVNCESAPGLKLGLYWLCFAAWGGEIGFDWVCLALFWVKIGFVFTNCPI